MSDASPESDGFEELLSSANEQDRIVESMAVITNRFRLFLLDMGVIFDVEEFLAGTGVTDRKYFDLDQLSMLATTNLLRVQTLSAAKVMNDIAVESGFIDLEIKKQLHAMLVSDGCSNPWIELVDMEFTGDLVNDDEVSMRGEAIVHALTSATNEAEQQAILEKLRYFLSEQGLQTLSPQDEVAIGELSVSLAILQVRSNDRLRGNLAETARLMVIEQGLDLNIWNRLITQFFEEQD
jgi:hypothetical protein